MLIYKISRRNQLVKNKRSKEKMRHYTLYTVPLLVYSQSEKLKVDRKMSGTMAYKQSCSGQLLCFYI